MVTPPRIRLRSALLPHARRVRHLLQKLQRAVDTRDPLVAIIRRGGAIVQGRYHMYFEVTLFGNNPVVLEEFGSVINRAHKSPPPMRPEIERLVQEYQYYIQVRQKFKRIEEAREYWTARGATALWHD